MDTQLQKSTPLTCKKVERQFRYYPVWARLAQMTGKGTLAIIACSLFYLGAGQFQSVVNGAQGGADLATAIGTLEAEASKLKRTEEEHRHFADLAKKVDETMTHPVIVRLRVPYRPEGEVGGVALEAQRELIVRVRKALLEKLVGFDPTSVKEYKFIPFLAVTINRFGLASLRDSELVLDIQEDSVSLPSVSKSTRLIGAQRAWESGFTGRGQNIAILDTGIEKTHPFLNGRIVAEACFSTSNPELGVSSVCPGGRSSSTEVNSGLPCEVAGAECDHGTHVAGIAAGEAPQFAGVAREAGLISIQVFSRLDGEIGCPAGRGPCVISYASDQLAALERVYELRGSHAIAAVNLGLGGGRYTGSCDKAEPAYKAAIDLLRSVDIATIVAAGNNGYTDALSAPACISTAISVGATRGTTEQTTQVASFSNIAPGLTFLAPGDAISSSVTGGGYAISSGTSMAAPHLAGAWALARQKSSRARVDDVLAALVSTSTEVVDARSELTRPRPNVDAALTLLGSNTVANSPPENPTGLQGIPFSNTQINLKWRDNSNNEMGFLIYRRTGTTGPFEGLDAIGPNSTTYKDNEVVTNTIYTYYIVAYNNYGRSLGSSEVTVTSLKDKLMAPTNLQAIALSANKVNLIWEDNSANETGFNIMRRMSSSGVWQSAGMVPPNTTTLTLDSLKPNNEYVFYVMAYNNAGESKKSNETAATTFSSGPIATLPPAAPSHLKAMTLPVKFRPKMALIEWTDNSDNEAGFKVYRKDKMTETWGLVSPFAPNTKELVNVGLIPGETYTYRVSAFNAIGETFADEEITVIAPIFNYTSITASQSLTGTLTRGERSWYRLYIPKGITRVTVKLTGRMDMAAGDVDLYVRYQKQPLTEYVGEFKVDEYDYASATKGINEECVIDNPATGDWHILVEGYSWMKAGYTISVSFQSVGADFIRFGNPLP